MLARFLQDLQYYLLPCHYIIGDVNGDSFVWEYTPDLAERFVTDGDGAPQCITNHSLQRYADRGDFRKQLQSSSTLQRYDRLVAETGEDESPKTQEDMKRIHGLVAATEAGGNRVRTLWHSLYDCEELSLAIDFFLGEEDSGDRSEKRSGYLTFTLDSSR